MENGEKEDNAFERHAQTLLTTLIALLLAGVAAFIFQIKDNQGAQLTEIRVLQVQFSNLNADLRQNDDHIKEKVLVFRSELDRIESYQNTMWARLRSANENVIILHRSLEALTGDNIELQTPEQF